MDFDLCRANPPTGLFKETCKNNELVYLKKIIDKNCILLLEW